MAILMACEVEVFISIGTLVYVVSRFACNAIRFAASYCLVVACRFPPLNTPRAGIGYWSKLFLLH